MSDADNGVQTDGGDPAQYRSDPGYPDYTTRRLLLGLLGAGSLAGIAGCADVLGGENQGGTTPSGTDAGGEGSATKTDETPTERHGELQESVTIGVRTNIIPASQILDWYLGYYTRATEPLVWITREMEPLPWLAESWTRTGRKTWEFTLRENVTFQNGDLLRADHVIATLQERIDAYSWAEYDYNIRSSEDGLRKLDERTIEMQTVYETVEQPSYLSHMSAAIHHPDSSPLKEGNSRADTIGTGPYRIESVQPDQHLTLSAYEDYWGGMPQSSGPQVDKLTIRVLTDNNTRTLALKGNRIDVGEELPPSQLDSIERTEGLTTATQVDAGSAKILFNLVDDPTADVTFRKALNYAISQEKIVTGSQNGLGVPARGPLPAISAASAHDSLPAYGPDRAKAKELIEESSYTGEAIQLVGMEGEPPDSSLIAQIVQQQAKAVGVDIEVELLGRAGLRERKLSGDGHLFMGTGLVTTPSAFDEIKHWIPPFIYPRSSPNTRPTNAIDKTLPEVQERINTVAKQALSSTGDERITALEEIQRLLMEEAVVIVPLFTPEYLVGMRNGIENVDWHPLARQSRLENLKFYQ